MLTAFELICHAQQRPVSHTLAAALLHPNLLERTDMSAIAFPRIDVRDIPLGERHTAVFNCFDSLMGGEALELVSEHDPLPLRKQFESRSTGRFGWTGLESGPAQWRVRITRLPEASATVRNDSCCSGGACCG